MELKNENLREIVRDRTSFSLDRQLLIISSEMNQVAKQMRVDYRPRLRNCYERILQL